MMNTQSKPARAFVAAAVLLAASALPAGAQTTFGPAVNTPTPALKAFADAYANVQDYTDTVTVSEQTNDGSKKQDRVYSYKYMKPHDALTFIESGPGKGGGAAWRGGDKVKGHQGGALTHLKLIVPIADPRAVSLRGDTIDTGTFTYDLAYMLSTPGTLAEAAGTAPGTTAVTLTETAPDKQGVTKCVLTLSNDTHMPVERQLYAGSTLVKTEQFSDVKMNTGLKIEDIDIV